MKKSKAIKWLALLTLTAMLLTSCAAVKDYKDVMIQEVEIPEALSTINVAAATAGVKLYAQNENFSLYVDEKNATFWVVDKDGNLWSSAPMLPAEDVSAAPQYADAASMSMVRINYCNQLNVLDERSSYDDCVLTGKAEVKKLANGVRFEFNFEKYGIFIPVQVLLCKDGVEISLINSGVVEATESNKLTSIDVAPFFHAPSAGAEGYFMVPDGEGALMDWNAVPKAGEYRGFVYGRDSAIMVYQKNNNLQDIRLPVFGAQFKAPMPQTEDETVAPAEVNTNARLGYTAIITRGAARAAINANIRGGSNPYHHAYTEYIYREIANVEVDRKTELQPYVEPSHTTIPLQTTRYVLMTGEELDYVDMAQVYRNYLQNECGLTNKTKADSAPLVVELFGGVMKQQFVMGFPVDQVVALTSYEDARNIVKMLKTAGIDELIINYTEWQMDGTGAAIQESLKAESKLGGNKGLQSLIDLCKQENISLYLDVNSTRMAKNAWGYNTRVDSASSVRWDPAMQFQINVNTGKANKLETTFLLKPYKMLAVSEMLAQSADDFDVTGLSSSALGEMLYSDFAKKGTTTRDHAEYFWKDAIAALQQAKGELLLSGGNEYALGNATMILDSPSGNSGYLCETRVIPFYQIALHGIVPMTTNPLNNADNSREAFLHAIETGTYLKWDWTARNQDELVETSYNDIISSHYENWMDLAVAQYKEAQGLLKLVSDCTIVEHEQVSADVVRVLWSNGTEVFVNYGSTAAEIDGIQIGAENFAMREQKGGA
jgi:hypothetical protein